MGIETMRLMEVFNAAYGEAGGGLRAMAAAYERVLPANDFTVTGIRLGPRTSSATGANNICLPSSGHYDIRAMLRAWRLLRERRPQCIICHCSRSLAIFRPAARLMRIPLVGVTHSKKLKRFIKADYMLAFSPTLKQRLVDLGYPADRIGLVANPVQRPARVKPDLGFWDGKSDVLRLGMLGMLNEQKGVQIAIQAVQNLRDAGTPISLTIAGEGEDQTSLQTMVSEFGLSDCVTFLGWVDDIDDFYSSIDALLVLSRFETFGLTIVEAFARRVSVIANRFLGFSDDYFKDRANSIVLEERSADALSSSLKWCMEHRQNVRLMIDQAESDFKQKFEAYVVAEQIRYFIQRINASS